MNCGLSNLDTLRKHLLAASLGAESKFDAVIANLGRGVAGLFETHCNRKLGWQADAQTTFTADREHFILPRYPLSAVSKIETRYGDTAAWEELIEQPFSTDAESGIIRFAQKLGDELTQVRVTWSGGYWFNTLEPDEDAYPEEMPDGATLLPGDLLGAFLLQCEAIWQSRDKLGSGVLGAEDASAPRIATLDLVPIVEKKLRGHIRYNLT